MFCILYSPNEEKDADLFQRNLLETRLSVGAKIRLQLSAQFSHALDMGLVSFLAY